MSFLADLALEAQAIQAHRRIAEVRATVEAHARLQPAIYQLPVTSPLFTISAWLGTHTPLILSLFHPAISTLTLHPVAGVRCVHTIPGKPGGAHIVSFLLAVSHGELKFLPPRFCVLADPQPYIAFVAMPATQSTSINASVLAKFAHVRQFPSVYTAQDVLDMHAAAAAFDWTKKERT